METTLTLRTRLASHWSNSNYSDLKVICGERQFNVHKLIVCAASEPLARACKDCYQEGRTGKIVIEDWDPLTVERFLHILYCDELDPADPALPKCTNDAHYTWEDDAITQEGFNRHQARLLAMLKVAGIAECFLVRSAGAIALKGFLTELSELAEHGQNTKENDADFSKDELLELISVAWEYLPIEVDIYKPVHDKLLAMVHARSDEEIEDAVATAPGQFSRHYLRYQKKLKQIELKNVQKKLDGLQAAVDNIRPSLRCFKCRELTTLSLVRFRRSLILKCNLCSHHHKNFNKV